MKSQQANELASLIETYRRCELCKLGIEREARHQPIVFGEGPIPADLMIIGESPGPEEEKNIQPFFPGAPCGQLLDKLLQTSGIDRKHTFITNALICAPLEHNGRVLNSMDKDRIFSGGAIKACSNRLRRTIEIVNPRVIVLLSKTAYIAVTGITPSVIRTILGWVPYEQHQLEASIFLSYHPSFYVRKKDALNRMNDIDPEYKDAFADVLGLSDLLKDHWKQISDKLGSTRQTANTWIHKNSVMENTNETNFRDDISKYFGATKLTKVENK